MKPKGKGKYYCVEAEKKFPKIRIAQSDYDRLKEIQQKYNYKSFGQVILRLLTYYQKYLSQQRSESYQSSYNSQYYQYYKSYPSY